MNDQIKAMIQPIPVQPTNKFTRNTPHGLLESLNKATDAGIKKIVIKNMIAKKTHISFLILQMAARPGFEPGLKESKSLVIPLHHRAKYSDF
jgi:hypothetical protein